jgi:hypothetical protein
MIVVVWSYDVHREKRQKTGGGDFLNFNCVRNTVVYISGDVRSVEQGTGVNDPEAVRVLTVKKVAHG